LCKRELFETVIPSKMFEAMAMARPVIIGVKGEARDIVREAEAGLEMEPESAESLVQAVELLADNPNLASRCGRAARAYVAKHYSRDVLASKYLRLLETIAAPRTGVVAGRPRGDAEEPEAAPRPGPALAKTDQ
jgi:glycosyltransferase involved in cell wall biosynthesis